MANRLLKRTSRRSRAWVVFAGLLCLAMLGPIDLKGFRQQAECGFVIRVDRVEEIAEPGTDRDRVFDIRASFTVLETLGNCPDKPPAVNALFSSEVHSSHPEAGEVAVCFLRMDRTPGPREAIYGRSYWRIRNEEQVPYVEVNWRNAFILSEVALRSDENAWLPLSAVRRLWQDVH